jgi:hypothetical protein
MAWLTPSPSEKKSTSSTPATSTTSPSQREGKLDLYAQKFVPAWLQNINSLPALRTILSPPPFYINFEEYAQTFLPKPVYLGAPSSQFLDTVRHERYALDVNPLGPLVPLQRLEMRNYAAHFRNALIEERRAMAEEFKQYNLFEVQLESTPWQKDGYKLSVPGIREYIPAVFVGDSLIIRAIRGPALPPFGHFDGTEFVAYIWAIDRLKV